MVSTTGRNLSYTPTREGYGSPIGLSRKRSRGIRVLDVIKSTQFSLLQALLHERRYHEIDYHPGTVDEGKEYVF